MAACKLKSPPLQTQVWGVHAGVTQPYVCFLPEVILVEIIVVQFSEGVELLHRGLAPTLQKLVHRHWFLAIDLSNDGK